MTVRLLTIPLLLPLLSMPLRQKPCRASASMPLGAPKLTAVHITESGEVVFELGDGEEYIVESVESVNDGTYVLSGNRGTITVSGAANAKMSIHVTLTTAEGATLSYDADNINVNVTTNLDNSEAMSNLCRTWIVLGIVIDIKGDVNAFREFEGGNLYEMALYANEQGAGLTAEELQELNRNIESVIIDGTGLITFNYSNHASDAASWKWNDDGTIKMTLKSSEMGNKYLNNKSTISVSYKDKRCVLRLNTSVSDSKRYDTVLTLRLLSKD